LYSFCTSCTINSIKYEVRVDNKLHGKIYIAAKSGIPIGGIITSANFTERGLTSSHEWGVEIDDIHMLHNIIGDLMKVCSDPLSYNEIEDIIKTIDTYAKENPPVYESKPKLEVTNHFKSKMKDKEQKIHLLKNMQLPSDTKFFIKPVGSSDNPFSEKRLLSTGIQELHFSKRRPNAVQPGDILICYGVGPTKLLGYFRVLSLPIKSINENDRWPWSVEAENLSPKYSSSWSSFNNTLSSVQASYGNEKELTYVGGKSLGALNFGADKIRLKEPFAHHIISIITESVK
jgi:hypothetical protein